MKQLLLLFMVFAGFSLASQDVISFTPDSLIKELALDAGVVDAKFDLGNTTSTDRQLSWKFERVDLPREWVFQICDQNLCYLAGTETMPAGADPSVIAADGVITGSFKVTIFNTGMTKGEGLSVFRVFDYNDSSVELGSINIYWNVTGGTSTVEISETQVQVYPNPADEYFKVSDNSEISSITLYDFLGRKVNNYNYRKEGEYSLTDVDKGIYYVACYDNKGETLSTKRLMKN